MTILLLLLTIFLSSTSEVFARKLFVFDVSKKDFRLETSFGTYPVVVGKEAGDKVQEGDRKTPEGVYFVTGEIPKSNMTNEHGTHAFALSFPNAWDRIRKVSGSNIWFHGSISEDRVDLMRDTRGCVALKNSDIDFITPILKTGIVFVRIWKDSIPKPMLSFDLKVLTEYQNAWMKRDFEAFKGFYDPEFKLVDSNSDTYFNTKKRTFKNYKEIDVKFLNPIALAHDKYTLVAFHQVYTSNAFKSEGVKFLYFKGNKIISEHFTNAFSFKDLEQPSLATNQ